MKVRLFFLCKAESHQRVRPRLSTHKKKYGNVFSNHTLHSPNNSKHFPFKFLFVLVGRKAHLSFLTAGMPKMLQDLSTSHQQDNSRHHQPHRRVRHPKRSKQIPKPRQNHSSLRKPPRVTAISKTHTNESSRLSKRHE